MAEHFLPASAASVHYNWNRDRPPVLSIRDGDTVRFACRDSIDAQVNRHSTLADFLRRENRNGHALTGPVFVEDARPGDTLEIEVLDIRHQGWGWSSIVPGLGFLSERFDEPFFFVWELEERMTRSMGPAVVPLAPFLGIMGVARGEAGEFHTRQPAAGGGNMDVRLLARGAKLYLPVLAEGALFSCGDAHAAQGDGEVCINGIEMPCEADLRFRVHRGGRALAGPWCETTPPPADAPPRIGEWAMIESGEDALAAARRATSRMVDFLCERWSYPPERAYVLCSAAMDLRFAQVVNRPVHTVTASLAKGLFGGG